MQKVIEINMQDNNGFYTFEWTSSGTLSESLIHNNAIVYQRALCFYRKLCYNENRSLGIIQKHLIISKSHNLTCPLTNNGSRFFIVSCRKGERRWEE